MNRRESLKTFLAGLLAPLAFLLPGKAKAKVKPKPTFPRYFAPVWSELAGSLASMEDSHGIVWALPREVYYADVRYLQAIRPDCIVFHKPTWAGRVKYDWSTLAACEEAVAIGYLREITATEAEILLKKPEAIRSFNAHGRRVDLLCTRPAYITRKKKT